MTAQYTPPGIVLSEEISPIGAALPAAPEVPCLVGPGSRLRRTGDLGVRRGLRLNAPVTLSATLDGQPGAQFSLPGAIRRTENFRLLRDGQAIARSQFRLNPPRLVSAASAMPDLDASSALLGLEVDGVPITICVDPTGDDTVVGRYVFADASGVGTLATPTPAEIATALNNGFVALEAAGVLTSGAGAGVRASVEGATLVLTSATLGSSGGIRALPMVHTEATSGSVDLGGASGLFGARQAPLDVRISSAALRPGAEWTADYTLQYSLSDSLDIALESAGIVTGAVLGVERAASAPGQDDFVPQVDWVRAAEVTGAAPITLDITDGNTGGVESTTALGVTVATGGITLQAGDILVDELRGRVARMISSSTATPEGASIGDLSSLVGRGGARSSLIPGLAQSLRVFRPVVPAEDIFQTGSEVGAAPGGDILWIGQQTSRIVGTAATIDTAAPASAPIGSILGLRLGIAPRVQVDLNTDSVTINGAAVAQNTILGPLGFATSGGTSLTPTQLRDNINAQLVAYFGPSADGLVRLNSAGALLFESLPERLQGLSIGTPATAGGVDDSGLVAAITTSSARVLTRYGEGLTPSADTIWYATPVSVRSSSDFGRFRLYRSKEQAALDLGDPNPGNLFSYFVQLCFRLGSTSVGVCQVDDATDPGTPTRDEWYNALLGIESTRTPTMVVLLDDSLETAIEGRQHLERVNAGNVGLKRSGVFSMPTGTPAGDVDTVETFINRAAVTLQVGSESQARGRMTLTVPPQPGGVTVNLRGLDGRVVRTPLPGWAAAVAYAGTRGGFASPAQTVASANLGVDWNLDDIAQPWQQGEVNAMAARGCCVLQFEQGGNFRFRDPVTTEFGNGGLIDFSYDNSAPQKDAIYFRIRDRLDRELIPTVPESFESFLLDARAIIASELEQGIADGQIGPYRDDRGNTRPLDLFNDISVRFDANNPTRFFFGYRFALRYIALRGFGRYTTGRIAVDLLTT